MVRLIASDIDGTLLHGSETEIGPSVFKEITRLMERGVLFCPASGRQYQSLRNLFAPIAGEIYYICENGAAIYAPGSPGPVIGQTVMPRNEAERLAHDILEYPSCEVLISSASTTYTCPKNADFVESFRTTAAYDLKVVSDPEAVPEDIIKVTAFCRNGTSEPEVSFAPEWRGRFHMAVSGKRAIDFSTADKGMGLAQLCMILGISLSEVMAFGDHYNDLPMLEKVGMPYIMDNAAGDLRSRFPNHCHRVEDVLSRV